MKFIAKIIGKFSNFQVREILWSDLFTAQCSGDWVHSETSVGKPAAKFFSETISSQNLKMYYYFNESLNLYDILEKLSNKNNE